MCLLENWSVKRKPVPDNPGSLMMAGQEGTCGHSPSVLPTCPKCVTPLALLRQRKAWMLCSQSITISAPWVWAPLPSLRLLSSPVTPSPFCCPTI